MRKMLSATEQQILYELNRILTTLIRKMETEKNIRIIDELQQIFRLLFLHKKLPQDFIFPPSIGESIYHSFVLMCASSDIRALQNGFSTKIKLLTVLILQNLNRSGTFSFEVDTLKVNNNNISYFTCLLLQRIDDPLLKQLISCDLSNPDSKNSVTKCIPLYLPSTIFPTLKIEDKNDAKLWTVEDANSVSLSLCQWLIIMPNIKSKFASKNQALATAELDGSTSRDLFTVLNTVNAYGNEYMLNIYSFSVLQTWFKFVSNQGDITGCLSSKLKLIQQQRDMISPLTFGVSRFYDDISSESDSASIQSISTSPSSLQSFGEDSVVDQLDFKNKYSDSRTQTPLRRTSSQVFDTVSITSDILSSSANSLKTVSTRYCLRILNQSDKIPKRESDRVMISASVVEAIKILSILCTNEPGHSSQKIYNDIKRFYKQIEASPLNARKVYVALIEFFIHHHVEMMVSLDDVLNIYMKDAPLKYYNNQSVCYEVLEVFFNNKEIMCTNKTLLKYIPNIFKIFAWWVFTFLEDCCEFVQFVTNNTNYLEILHLILDLPCLTALLHLKHTNVLEDPIRLEEILGCPIKIYFRSMFFFILRETSGGAETIDKLNELHHILKRIQYLPRVQYSSQLVPHALESYFGKINEINDLEVTKSLYPVLLERAFLLYPLNDKQEEIIDILCQAVRNIVQFAPGVVANYHEETISFFNQFNAQKFSKNYIESFLSSVVWCVAVDIEHASCTEACCYYECFETFIYEISSFSDNEFSPDVVSSLLSALAKVASNTQELIPRAIVCLSKLNSLKSVKYRFVCSYAKELINVLNKPKTSPSIFMPFYKISPWHLDSHFSIEKKIHFLTSLST